MSADSSLQLRRRNLYGPGRLLQREAAKELLQKDHLQINFKEGARPDWKTFQTITAKSFREKESLRDQISADVGREYQSNCHFYLDHGAHQATSSLTKEDFVPKPIPLFRRHIPAGTGEVNLVDMAPKYRIGEKFETSQYKSHTDDAKTWFSKYPGCVDGASKRFDTMRFHKAAHFSLGSDKDSPTTVTSLAYNLKTQQPQTYPKGCSKTFIFREGDYNFPTADPNEHFTTTQRNDYNQSLVVGHKASHILPRCPVQDPVSMLRRMLIQRNEEAFKNPRDPMSLNVMKAFATYDQKKCGSISVDDITAMNKTFGIPLKKGDVDNMLKECGCGEEGKLDFFKFCKYLTVHTEPEKHAGEFVSTSMATYLDGSQGPDSQENEDEEEAEDNLFGVTFQTRAHFLLGSDEPQTSSIYGKDFDSSRVKGLGKTPRAPNPPNSKVMHEYPRIAGSISTSRTDYTRHDDIAQLEFDRMKGLHSCKARHGIKSVHLENDIDGTEASASTTKCSYGAPHSTAVVIHRKPVLKEYHHLESNRALPHPMVVKNYSESQHHYKQPFTTEKGFSSSYQTALGLRTARTKLNKSAHFFLGTDHEQMRSECMDSYDEKDLRGQSSAVAGKLSLPTRAYSITAHEDDTSGQLLHDASPPRHLQQQLQQRNRLKHINPRDTVNLNLSKAFMEYDKHRCGAISKDDLRKVCKEMKVDVSEEDIECIIQNCDTQGNGLIDYNEFALNLSQVHHPSSQHREIGVASITMKDFVHPKEHQMTGKQLELLKLEAKRFRSPEISSTHYFHMHPDSTDILKTVAGKDYIAPENM